MKILLVSSSGGHLDQLLWLAPALRGHEVRIATFAKPDAIDACAPWTLIPLYYPTNRSAKALLINGWRALKLLVRFRPDALISTGAASAVPFFYVNAVRRSCLLVYVEPYDRVTRPTLTARLVRPVADHVIVFWSTQLPHFRKRIQIEP